jgi:hypothetical protein
MPRNSNTRFVYIDIYIDMMIIPRCRLEVTAQSVRLDDLRIGVGFPAVAGVISHFHRYQTGCGTHPASYQMSTGAKRQGYEAEHSSSSSADVKNGGATPLPICLRGVVFN